MTSKTQIIAPTTSKFFCGRSVFSLSDGKLQQSAIKNRKSKVKEIVDFRYANIDLRNKKKEKTTKVHLKNEELGIINEKYNPPFAFA